MYICILVLIIITDIVIDKDKSSFPEDTSQQFPVAALALRVYNYVIIGSTTHPQHAVNSSQAPVNSSQQGV